MTRVLPLTLLAFLVTACNKDKAPPQAAEDAAATPVAVASSAAVDLPSLPKPPEQPDPVCTVVEQKVWGKWANQRTGLTPRKLDSQMAVGVAFGNRPHVLVFDGDGKGKLVKIEPYAGSPLATDLKEPKGRRDLQRVTPVVIDGKLTAYADYRDKHNDSKRRRIACELVSENKPVLVFDDTPLLLRPAAESKPAARAATTATAAAPAAEPAQRGRLKLPKRAVDVVAVAPDAAADAAVAAVDPPPATKAEPQHEIRDCRSFVDADGTVWGVGSQLYGDPKDDGIVWSMRFVAVPAGGRPVLLDSRSLPKNPKDPSDLHTLEAPVAQELGGGEHALFGRYRGTLYAFLLDKNFRARGGRKTYGGGHPGLARFFHEAGQRHMVVSQKTGEDQWALRSGNIDSALPKALATISLEGRDASLSEPSLALAGSTRWLSYHAGARRSGTLEVVPVDKSFAATGRAHVVTSGEEVYESMVVGLSDGKLLVTYIASLNATPVLASQVLSCSVKT